MIPLFALTWLVLLAGFCLGWQLLRQNGRMLLRLDELEKRLDSLEVGEPSGPAGLSLGSPAPDFDLPDLKGERKSLAQFRGQPLLLIFFNPACGFCRDLAPKLAALFPPADTLSHSMRKKNGEVPALPGSHKGAPQIVLISTGDPDTNRQFFAEDKLDCPVLLQKQMEVATAYRANGTPSGYLISPEGKIARELAIGADALLMLWSEQSKIKNQKSQIDQTSAPAANGNGRENRFRNRSLAGSRLKRDGLKAGTPAPDFRLARLDGSGDLSLQELRGQRVLLVFSSPQCGPCNALAPELEKFHCAQQNGTLSHPGTDIGNGQSPAAVQVLMISKGKPKENHAKVKEHGLTFPIVLQQQWEISRLYAMFATPIAYLIDEQGMIVHDVAVGTGGILELMGRTEVLSLRVANSLPAQHLGHVHRKTASWPS